MTVKEILPIEGNGSDIVPAEAGTQVVATGGPALMDVSRLRELARTADERVRYMAQIMRASVTACGRKDWVDLGGKPYPMEVGAERMARLWGVHVQITDGPDRLEREGHYLYRTKVRAWSDLLGRSTEVVGMRSSKDPFFCVRYLKQPDGSSVKTMLLMEEVNERDIAAASQTNAKVRAIGEILGLRGLAWEDLADYGVTPEGAAGRVTYSKPASPETPIPEAAGIATDEQLRTEMREWLLALNKNDKDAARKQLIDLTAFVGKNGPVPGVNSTEDLKGKRLKFAHSKVKRLVTGAALAEPEPEGDE